ncbi:MAG TPA: FAD-dependent monooxygenase [Allosphingosinicella sp.]|nr:FAD-dependent monooxygenase [Allosphingosinicella sp.]
MPRILIVGAGISGLTLVRAIRLIPSADEWDIHLIERALQFSPAGCGIVLHPNGCSALSVLGLERTVARRSAHLKRMEIRRNGQSMVLNLEDVWAGAGHPTLAVTRPALHDVLAGAALADGPGRVSLRLGCRLVGLDLTGPRPVASFSDGNAAEYDLVVGADGAHSTIRQAVAPSVKATPTGTVYLRFLADNVIRLPEDRWLVFEGPDIVRGYIPVGENRLHCFVQLHAPARPDSQQAAEILDAQAHRDPDFAACLEKASPIHIHAAYVVEPVTWGRGTCVLIGDSAHAVAPSLSEGGSLAMEDALALASALQQFDSIAEAMSAYATRRQEPVIWAQRMSRAQVNAGRRNSQVRPVDPAAATKHMRCMYEPLRRGAARDRDGAAFWWSENAPPNKGNGHGNEEQVDHAA